MSLLEAPELGVAGSPKAWTKAFRLVTGSGLLLAFLGVIANLIVLGHEGDEVPRPTVVVFKAVSMHIIALFGCIMVAACEVEWRQFLDDYFIILKNWIARGIFYVFVGALVLEARHGGFYADNDGSTYRFIFVVACGLTVLGALYVAMGLLLVCYALVPADDDDF